jgi:chemotaxis protein methyltransferase CheR
MSDPIWTAATSAERDVFTRLSSLLAHHSGLTLMPNQWRDLQRALIATAAELKLPDFLACAECVLASSRPRPLQLLIDHLTIGETYFFRDKAVFAVLREHLLPELIQARCNSERRLRIWCAGCSTGEEAYSIAIELKRALPDLARWDATILATDINQRFLLKASNGSYDGWSFRDSSPEDYAPYILANDEGRFSIASVIKNLVHFSHLNLAEKIYPSPINGTDGIDIIFCRNVLMYLQPETVQSVLKRLCEALRPDGWLIVSNVEAPLVNLPNMTPVRLPDLMLFRKTEIDAKPIKNDQPINKDQSIKKYTKNPSHLRPNNDSSEPQNFKSDRVVQIGSGQVPQKNPLAQQALTSEEIDLSAQLLQDAKTNADRGHFDSALKSCKQALAIDKLNSATHYLLASILLEANTTTEEAKTGDIRLAVEQSLKRALYLDSEWIMPHIALGNLLLSQPGRQAEAKRHFDNARALLNNIPLQQVVAKSEGHTAGQLLEMINIMSIAEATP